MSDTSIKPEIIVFAGPNGSGKSTITKFAKTVGKYINADDIKKVNNCSDLEAAQTAEKMREEALQKGEDFTFETVLSTDRNLNLLKRAKEKGYFIRCFYVLTANPDVNVARVSVREMQGGHGVPEDKIRERYKKALKLIPELIQVCDILHIYDNTEEPFRIFKKRKTKYFRWESKYWSKKDIEELTGITAFDGVRPL
ncbi:MAG: zeta toxin family protein [Lachnospiraceae bacterium]|nr:zeta toxin family protein [Lachnospiraceae bacterium]